LDAELSKFYLSLLKSESRHFHDYLQLAIKYSPVDITDRVAFFADKERELILSPDHEFRFHSGAFTAAQA
jgi:tRNA-(ms[2]io[6]A)-hydroxylase